MHLVLVDLRESELDGQQAEDRLHEIGITVNRNAVPFDPRPPVVSSGLRVGTPALATRGVGVEDFPEIGRIIAPALQPGFERRRAELAERVAAIAERYPLYAQLGAPAAVADGTEGRPDSAAARRVAGRAGRAARCARSSCCSWSP